MPLLEDKLFTHDDYQAILVQFKTLLMDLLKNYTHNQNHIAQLVQENEALKNLLHTESKPLSKEKQELVSLQTKKAYITQIDAYIKDIDACLAYFEQ